MEEAHKDLTPLAFLGPTEIMDTNEYEDADEELLDETAITGDEATEEMPETEATEEMPETEPEEVD